MFEWAKDASVLTFIVEKVYRMLYLSYIVNVNFVRVIEKHNKSKENNLMVLYCMINLEQCQRIVITLS